MKHLGSRLINLCRAEWSYLLSLVGVVSVKHKPVFVSIEPADYCQLHCPQCPVGINNNDAASQRRQHHLLSIDDFKTILQRIQSHVWTIQFYFQGEPLLNKQLSEMIRLAHDEDIYTIVSTNAQSLTADMANDLISAGLSRIIVSMDGLSQESYEQYRVGGSVQKVIDGLRYLREAKMRYHARTTIELQCLRLRSNEHEWGEFKRLYRSFGADKLTFKTAQFYDFEHGNPLMPSNERYSRYQKIQSPINNYQYQIKQSLWLSTWRKLFGLTPCHRLWTGCVITTTGTILPCCYDKSAAHAYGNIHELSPITFHLSPFTFISSVLHSSADIDICRNCNR